MNEGDTRDTRLRTAITVGIPAAREAVQVTADGRAGCNEKVVLKLKIRDIQTATPRTRIIRLDLGGHRLNYHPGQAVFVGGENEKGVPYSLTAPPEEAHSTGCLEILSRVGHYDSYLTGVTAGRLQVAGPIGQFTLPSKLDATQRLVFVAGGTGIAPLRSMLKRAVTSPGCQIELLYSARASDEFPFENELRAMALTGRIRLWQTVTRDSGTSGWTGARGRIGGAVLEPIAADPAALFLICGPLALVNDTHQLLERAGVCPNRIKTDRW